MDIEIRDDDGTPVPDRRAWARSGSRGPNVIRGYWNKPEATAEAIVDGWLRTGDLGRLDDEGFIYVEDRAKDMVLRAGENIYCAEVEAPSTSTATCTRRRCSASPTTGWARRWPA